MKADFLKIPSYNGDFFEQEMDLGTIRKRLNTSFYQSADQCIGDFNLVFTNCYRYNKPDTDIVMMAKIMEKLFLRMLLNMPQVEEELGVESQMDGLDQEVAEKLSFNELLNI